jgi:hypothetical protein
MCVTVLDRYFITISYDLLILSLCFCNFLAKVSCTVGERIDS